METLQHKISRLHIEVQENKDKFLSLGSEVAKAHQEYRAKETELETALIERGRSN